MLGFWCKRITAEYGMLLVWLAAWADPVPSPAIYQPGAADKKLETTLREKFPDKEKQQEIIEKLRFVAVEACRTLEGSIGSSGEMGVDIGIDKGGQVWFIEANLRPARQVFTLIGEKKTRMLSVMRPMLYCRYLAGF